LLWRPIAAVGQAKAYGCAGFGAVLGNAPAALPGWRRPARDPKTQGNAAAAFPAGAAIEDCCTLASETTGVSALAERYAAALFEIAEERRALDEVASDLRQLRAMLAASVDLMRLVRSPVLSRLEQGRAVAALALQAELSALVRDFLAVVSKNRRLFAVPAMIDAYLAKLAERRGEVTASVTAAQPLNETQLEALGEHLRRAVGRRVTVDVRVDPRLIGGLIVKVGSRMVDASVESKLRRLQFAMKGIG
jgi:F-type H+-transporting ATPase subunit delta